QLREAGLYRMLVPRELGGLQVDFPTFLRVAELIAGADGSVGWNLTNNGIEQLIALSLPDEGVREVFATGPDNVIAGTAAPGGGRGEAVEGGYVVSGRWRFGSGCKESQWMLGNFEVAEGQLYRFFVPIAEADIIETWDMTGMLGTGSHDWAVDQVF